MRTTILSGLLLATITVAYAEPSAERIEAVREHLKAADSNGDGYIDRAEADAKLPRIAKNFGRLDADGDGRLSQAELTAAVEKLQARRR